MRKKIVAGNWKMNTLPAEGVELAKNIVAGRGEVCSCVNFIVCPPFTHLSTVAEALKGSDVALGAQNCAAEAKGAYTGEIAASMIAALGCKYVILGHSERRQYYGETSETLNKKMAQAYANGLTPIYCVGENLEEREAGKHFDVVKAQIEEVVYNLTAEQYKGLVIAYEPVWAIGTGKTATAEQAQEIHAYIRKVLAEKFGAAAEETAILYGGSCKPSNAAEIFAKEDVDGGLIGGAAPQGGGLPRHRQRLCEISGPDRNKKALPVMEELFSYRPGASRPETAQAISRPDRAGSPSRSGRSRARRSSGSKAPDRLRRESAPRVRCRGISPARRPQLSYGRKPAGYWPPSA